MNKIKSGDQVIIITGKDKGKSGKVLRFLGERLVVEGLNMVKKHVRPNPNKNIEGGIISKEASIHISNIAIYNPETKKADAVGVKIEQNGKKVRFYKSNQKVIG